MATTLQKLLNTLKTSGSTNMLGAGVNNNTPNIIANYVSNVNASKYNGMTSPANLPATQSKPSFSQYSAMNKISPLAPATYNGNQNKAPYDLSTAPKTANDTNNLIKNISNAYINAQNGNATDYNNYVYGNGANDNNSGNGGNASPVQVEIPRLSTQQSKNIVKNSGLAGITSDTVFAGMTQDEADQFLAQKKASLLKNNSANTSSIYNSETLDPTRKIGIRNIIDKYAISLKDNFSDPFKTNQDKVDGGNTILDDSFGNVVKLVGGEDNFNNLYKNSTEFKVLIDEMDSKATLYGNSIKNKLPDLTTGDSKIDNTLSPVRKGTEMQLDYLQNIPDQYKALYYGDQGYFSQMKNDALKQIDDINNSFSKVQQNTIDALDLQAKKNELDAQAQIAQIEEDRVSKKNYMTGMLAKLGALTTTGEAPASIARLDAKYDQMVTSTKNSLAQAQSNIAKEKASQISALEQDRQNKIYSIKSDLNKNSMQIQKDILSVEMDTKNKISGVIGDYNKEVANVNKTYLEIAQKQAEAYNKMYSQQASGGLSDETINSILNGEIVLGAFNSKTAPYYDQVAKAAAARNGSYNAVTAKAAASSIADLTKQLNNRQRVVDTLDRNMPLLVSLADKVNTLGVPFLDNYKVEATGKMSNNPDVLKYINTINTIRAEYAQALAMGGQVTESMREEAKHAIPLGQSGNNYQALEQQLKLETANIVESYKSQIKSLQGNNMYGGGNFIQDVGNAYSQNNSYGGVSDIIPSGASEDQIRNAFANW